MKNGEGAVSSGVNSPDPLDGGFQKLGGGEMLSPVSSRYSSCGESDFERYCSANSVMGTPSLCSSMGVYHDVGDSDFGSLKSLEGFSLGGERFPGRFEKRLSMLSGEPSSSERDGLSPLGGFEGQREVADIGGISSPIHGTALDGGIPMVGTTSEGKQMEIFDGEAGKKEDLAILLKNVENVLLQGAVAARSAAETLFDSNHADEMEDERCREHDDASSRYEHSDGEDSMFNYGSDAGSLPNAYYVKNVENHCEEDEGGGNLVLMNPSVAFGSRDWEDFELDGGENSQVFPFLDNLWEQRQPSCEKETSPRAMPHPTFSGNLQWHDGEKSKRAIATGDHLQGADKSSMNWLSCSTVDTHSSKLVEAVETSRTYKEVQSDDGSDDYLESSLHDVFVKQCPSSVVPNEVGSLKGDKERQDHDTSNDNTSDYDDHPIANQHSSPLPDTGDDEPSLSSTSVQKDPRFVTLAGDRFEIPEDYLLKSVSSSFENDNGRIHDALNLYEEKNSTNKGKNSETDAFYDEFVHEMEEILLDSCDSTGARMKQKNTVFHSKQYSPLRDGGSTASTSSLNNGYPLSSHPLGIDGIEVVGAKQKTGDISLSERLVGVKGYTMYVIRVWSGNYQWEVERRYRDFYSLYRHLKTFFAAQGWILPPPWSSVEQESKKFFGNGSPEVIAERSALIQECLCSILQSKCSFSSPSALIWFLSPPETLPRALQSNSMAPQSDVGADERVSNFGKTISLIVEILPQKSVKELLEMQHHTCAGCHKHFDIGKTRMQEIVQTFGWGKPRLCEYTGQLFCSSCHTNDTAVLPARILHHWDFTPNPVSQLAKSYLDSIIDQPMLCVSAANPFLLSRVPTLLHIVGMRRKIGAMLPCIRCSFRRSIYRRLGYRKYLLETKDFFAIRDLIDLSKGAFAALPTILEAVLKKIEEHITELCLECCDSGVPCGARQACENPSSLIFPFQEEEDVARCKSCKSVFHKHCFDKLVECPCGAVLKVSHMNQPMTTKLSLEDASDADESLTSSSKKSEVRSSLGFLSSMFPVSRQGKNRGHKDSDNVILMGSLPSTSL